MPLRILEVSPSGNLTAEDLFILNGQLSTADGAGIRNEGNLYLRRVTVAGNFTTSGNGAGLYNLGRATIRNSVFTTNLTLAGNGAGIYNNGDLHIIDSTVVGNVLNNQGGGLYTAAGRTSQVVRSAVNGNLSATQAGAGIASAGTTTLDQHLGPAQQVHPGRRRRPRPARRLRDAAPVGRAGQQPDQLRAGEHRPGLPQLGSQATLPGSR